MGFFFFAKLLEGGVFTCRRLIGRSMNAYILDPRSRTISFALVIFKRIRLNESTDKRMVDISPSYTFSRAKGGWEGCKLVPLSRTRA